MPHGSQWFFKDNSDPWFTICERKRHRCLKMMGMGPPGSGHLNRENGDEAIRDTYLHTNPNSRTCWSVFTCFGWFRRGTVKSLVSKDGDFFISQKYGSCIPNLGLEKPWICRIWLVQCYLTRSRWPIETRYICCDTLARTLQYTAQDCRNCFAMVLHICATVGWGVQIRLNCQQSCSWWFLHAIHVGEL